MVLVGSAGWLGFWQLDAWQDQRAADSVDRTFDDPEPLADVMGPDDPFPGDKVGQPVSLSGTWVGDGTVFVSGREHDGDDGYWVVTPLAIGAADAPALPVVRGWVASPADAPAAPSGTAELVAWLQPTEGTGEVDDDPTDDVLPQVRTADLIQHVDQDLYGAYAVAPDTRARPGSRRPRAAARCRCFSGLRNLLYAIEWWFFGAFAAFIWWRYVTEAATREPDSRRPGTFGAVISLFNAYRALALIVGVLLAFCTVAFVLKYALTEGSGLQQFGEDASIMWLVHGWVFMVYVVVAFLLSRRASWSIGFTLLTLIAGLVPLLIFWVEHQVNLKVRAENPELVSSTAAHDPMTTAFVLGGGGVLGAVEVGMLRALLEREITPDLVLGTSVGALNGAMVARQPDLGVIDRMTELWRGASASGATTSTATARCAPSGGRW